MRESGNKGKNSMEMKQETLKLNNSIIHESLNGLSEPSPKFGQCWGSGFGRIRTQGSVPGMKGDFKILLNEYFR